MGVGKSTFTFTNSSITIDGGSTTINITRDNQSYSHKLRHGFGDIATLAVGTTSYTWKPTAAQLTKFFEEVPNQKTRQIDVTLDTYNGSTLVGSDCHALTVTLSEATGKPVITSYTITDSNTVAKTIGIWVYGKSSTASSKINLQEVVKYGSKTTEDSWHVGSPFSNGYTGSGPGNALDWAANVSGDNVTQVSIELKVKNSRGFWSDACLNKYYVAKYKAPHIDTFEVLRCDESGAESDSGTKAKVTIKGSWAAMKVGTAYKNAATLKVGYRIKDSTGAYTFQSISVSAGAIDISQLLSATLASDTDYEFSVILSDAFSEADSRSEVGFSNVGNILYISPDGKELVIGSDGGSNVAIDEDSLDIRSKKNVLASFGVDADKNAVIQSSKDLYLIAGMGSQSVGITTLIDNKPTGYGFKVTNNSGLYNTLIKGNNAEIYSDKNPIQITSGRQTDMSLKSGALDDWIVSQGMSGNWIYRKWASGFAECYGYGRTTAKMTTLLSSSKGYYDSSLTGGMTFPFTFTKIPYCSIHVVDGDGYCFFVCNAFATTTKAATGYFYSLISHTSTVEVDYYAQGWWK